MDNSTILYIGIFCFAMMGLGMGLTVYEFKKMALEPGKKRIGNVEPTVNEGLRTASAFDI